MTGVDRWPEDEQQGGIDAIIGSYAVQHTSVDSVTAGREADTWFKKVVGDLERELAGKLEYGLFLSWDWAAIQKGQDWGATQKALRNWITSNEPRDLVDGRHEKITAPGIPFTFNVFKGGLQGFKGVSFARHDPKDTTLPERLFDQLTVRHEKIAALGKYRAEGMTTVLLLQAMDIALMDGVTMVDALESAFSVRRWEVEEVWFMHYVVLGTVNVYDLRLGGIWIFDPNQHTIQLHNPCGPSLAWSS